MQERIVRICDPIIWLSVVAVQSKRMVHNWLRRNPRKDLSNAATRGMRKKRLYRLFKSTTNTQKKRNEKPSGLDGRVLWSCDTIIFDTSIPLSVVAKAQVPMTRKRKRKTPYWMPLRKPSKKNSLLFVSVVGKRSIGYVHSASRRKNQPTWDF